MKIKQKVIKKLEQTQRGTQFANDRIYRAVTISVLGLIFNLLFAFYNGALGLLTHSVWSVTVCFYYLLLSAMRFCAILSSRNNSIQKEISAMKQIGILLTVLSIILTVILYISIKQNVASKYGQITMITIATYTFTKIITAIIKAAKNKSCTSPLLKTFRTISYCEIAVSVYTMQRSMLVSFGAMHQRNIHLMNTLTGTAMCIFSLTLGIILIINSQRRRLWLNQKY